MFTLEIKTHDCITNVSPSGNIDSTNAPEFEEKVFSVVDGTSSVVLDLINLDYISSAGLRVILKIKKTANALSIINANRDVYEVFDMTGFTQIMEVKKCLREISIEGKELIGEGYMGKVYRLDPETIIKVYIRGSTLDDIGREIKLAKKAFILGVPTAIPFDVVKVKEAEFGSVFELINSKSLNSLIAQNPNRLDEYVKLYGDLLKTISSTIVDDKELLPSKKDFAKQILKSCEEREIFDKTTMDKLFKLIDTIPDVDNLVHGDYHIKNIMMQGDEPLLIDMDTLGHGHPYFEIAAFFLTYVGYPATEPGNIPQFLGITEEAADKLFKAGINALYGDRSEKEKEEIIEKVSIFAYAWLADKTFTFEKENVKRFEHARQVVLQLVDRYQSLNF